MKKSYNPSPKQIAHRHKFVTIGAIESMHTRLHQLINDKMIPSGALKLSLISAHDFIHKACREAREIEIEVK